MTSKPRSTLLSSLRQTKKTLATKRSGCNQNSESGSAKTNVEGEQLSSVLQPRKRKKTANTADPDRTIEIRLPRPANGAAIYTPGEAVLHIHNADQDKENLCSSTNKNYQRTYMSRYKAKMISEKLVPCKISALNDLVSKHGKVGQPSAPIYWDMRGRPAILDLQALFQNWKDQQQSRECQGWEWSDTKKAIWDAAKANAEKRGDDQDSINCPTAETVTAYHSALMCYPEVAQRISSSKPVHRDVAETSARSVLSNVAGIIASRSMTLRPGQVPNHLKFDASKATKGVLIARELYAKAVGVPANNVQYSPLELLSNVDDKACMYSNGQGDGSCDGAPETRDVVLVNRDAVSSNPGYSIHNRRDGTKRFRGQKIRVTNLIGGGGHYGAPWVQVLDLTPEEMPPDKVPKGYIIIPLPGLQPNGNLSPGAKGEGFCVLMRKGQGIETATFAEYEKKVRMKFTDDIKRDLGLDPNNVDKWARSVLTLDGGVPQMKATMDMDSLNTKVQRNELQAKICKNTSGVFQPNDVGNGHVREGHWFRVLGPNDMPHINLTQKVTAALYHLRDKGEINLSAEKLTNVINCISRVPTVINKSYDERSIIQAFVRPGWIGEGGQGVDVLKMFQSYKAKLTQEMKDKWIQDLPSLIKEMIQLGRIREETFDSLGYPVDTDKTGKAHNLPEDAITTQHHRQRFTMMTHPKLLGLFRQATTSAIAVEVLNRAALAEEEQWLLEQLEVNTKFEQMLHGFYKRPQDLDDCVNLKFLSRKS